MVRTEPSASVCSTLSCPSFSSYTGLASAGLASGTGSDGISKVSLAASSCSADAPSGKMGCGVSVSGWAKAGGAGSAEGSSLPTAAPNTMPATTTMADAPTRRRRFLRLSCSYSFMLSSRLSAIVLPVCYCAAWCPVGFSLRVMTSATVWKEPKTAILSFSVLSAKAAW